MPAVSFRRADIYGAAPMHHSTEIHRLEEVLSLLQKVRLLTVSLSGDADDLDSLVSVAESEARRLRASALARRPGDTRSGRAASNDG
jgi:hypothetical protein